LHTILFIHAVLNKREKRHPILLFDPSATPAGPAAPLHYDNHYSWRTGQAYVYWARWYIRFHGRRHPMEMGAQEIQSFMSFLVNERQVAGATYSQAPCG
jgi:hypothetical protein